jgi:outer membrane murein-binding lipoprotein Lpp
MEILLVVTTLAVGVAVLYVTATFRTRTRQNTAPLIDCAVKNISGQLVATTAELKRQLQLMADELQREREDTRLEVRKIQGRLDHADSRLSSVASQLMVELETIRRLGEHVGAGQDQLSGDLQQLNHQVAQLSEATRQFPPLAHADRETAAAEAAIAETAPVEASSAQANGREGPADVPGPARPADEALDSPSGPVAAGPGPG